MKDNTQLQFLSHCLKKAYQLFKCNTFVVLDMRFLSKRCCWKVKYSGLWQCQWVRSS